MLDAWTTGQRLSAVGPGDVGVHLEHARGFADLIDSEAESGLDIGTGAGIPGLALAGLRPNMTWTLMDAALRRCRLLEETVIRAGWAGRVVVRHGRAEDLARELGPSFGVVTARLFGPPPVTAECAAPFVRAGGQVLISDLPLDEGDDGSRRWPDSGLAALGLVRDGRSETPSVQVLRATGSMEGRFPRKAGVATKRPVW